jgi:flagella basal body P-ring formation protein FlgA
MNPLWFHRMVFNGLSRICRAGVAASLVAFSAAGAETPQQTATNQSPAFQFRSTSQVDSDGVFLNQIATPPGELPHLRLCDSPAFGKSIVLKRSELNEMARVAGYEMSLTNWTGPDGIRITRRSRSLDEREALQLLTLVLQQQYVKDLGELELRLSRPWLSTTVPDEAFSLKVLEIPTSGVAPMFIVRFELETSNGEHFGSWQACVQAKVWREVWVAGSPLKRGDLLRGADVSRERRDMLLCREPLANITDDDRSLEFSQSVQAGAPIVARMLRPRAIVHRGQSMAAVVQDGALMITLKVEALEDGAAGQVIRVRNPLSRRDLRAQVLDEQNVRVSL